LPAKVRSQHQKPGIPVAGTNFAADLAKKSGKPGPTISAENLTANQVYANRQKNQPKEEQTEKQA
jgi:hypothetical protein